MNNEIYREDGNDRWLENLFDSFDETEHSFESLETLSIKAEFANIQFFDLSSFPMPCLCSVELLNVSLEEQECVSVVKRLEYETRGGPERADNDLPQFTHLESLRLRILWDLSDSAFPILDPTTMPVVHLPRLHTLELYDTAACQAAVCIPLIHAPELQTLVLNRVFFDVQPQCNACVYFPLEDLLLQTVSRVVLMALPKPPDTDRRSRLPPISLYPIPQSQSLSWRVWPWTIDS